jgi:tight adherence protein C
VAPLGAFALDDLLPVVVFIGIVAGVFWLMTLISNRNSMAESRLDRIGRPKSLADLDAAMSGPKFGGLKDASANSVRRWRASRPNWSGTRSR